METESASEMAHSSRDAVLMRIRRTPLACGSCRRRKIKCGGQRPQCRQCRKRSTPCVWPTNSESPPIAETDTSTTFASAQEESRADLPSKKAYLACYELFFSRHWAPDFCRFLYWPDLEAQGDRCPLLGLAIVVLCCRYLTQAQTNELFNLPSPDAIRDLYYPVVSQLARESDDEPTVCNVQANLILGFAELLDDAGSRHWMRIGVAIRMAQIMRLNKEFHQSHTPREQELRRRTFWACMLQDRTLAYFLAKPRTICEVNVSAFLPGSDLLLLYGELSRGVRLESFGDASLPRPSELGVLPYLIKATSLWSDIADIRLCHGRFVERLAPTDPAGCFYQRHQALTEFMLALPPGLVWSWEGYKAHCRMGYGHEFVALSFLLRSAHCAGHQLYLPLPSQAGASSGLVDAAGLALTYQEPCLIVPCVENALAIGAMLTLLQQDQAGDAWHPHLQSTWVAASMLSAVPTLLWLQYSQDGYAAGPEDRQQAGVHLDLIDSVLSLWSEHWPAAGVWRESVKTFKSLYKRTYTGAEENPTGNDVEAVALDDSSRPRVLFDGIQSQPDYRPSPGDGQPVVQDSSSLLSSIRLNIIDQNAKMGFQNFIFLQAGYDFWAEELADGLN